MNRNIEDPCSLPQQNLHTSMEWNLMGELIYINNSDPLYSWSTTAAENDWCSGSGSWQDPYIIENVTIIGSSAENCILICDSSIPFIIRNCKVSEGGSLVNGGIKLVNVNNSLIINNNCSENQIGIVLQYNSNNNTVIDNLCNNNYWHGIFIEQNCCNNTFTSNIVQFNPNGLYMRQDCTRNRVINSIFTNNTEHAIYIKEGCNETVISGNYITNNTFEAIYIRLYCYNSEISNNKIEHNGYALEIGGWSENSIIKDNNISNNRLGGIDISTCSKVDVVQNKILNNKGIGLNIIAGQYCIVKNNIIINNTNFGVNLGAACENNYIYNNTFIGNGQNAQERLDGINNYWYFGGLGNFWDDYKGEDENGNNIGDTPYAIPLYPSGNTWDNYPQYFFDFLYIDDTTSKNWEWAKVNGYCSGSGSYSDPYLIKDLVIDEMIFGYFNQVNFLHGIIIKNSEAFFNITNCTITNLEHTGLEIINAKNGYVENNNFSKNGLDAIVLRNCQNTTIINNTMFDNGLSGILMDNCDISKIYANLISNNGYRGLDIDKCNNDEIFDNFIQFNMDDDVFCDDSTYLIFKNNTIQNSDAYENSLFLWDCDNCIIENNIMTGNWIGINLNQDSDSNEIINNFVDPGYYGILLNHIDDSGNVVYKNTIISATDFAWDYGSNNYWDNGSIGNYWGNYVGVDADDDGIGDSAYSIKGTANSEDRYPIWDDGEDGYPPNVNIITPTLNSVYSTASPDFSVHINELYLHKSWYQLVGGSSNYTFNGISGTVNQDLWNEFSEGPIILRVFANDTYGNIGHDEVIIYKDITEPEINILSPDPFYLFGNETINYEIFIIDPNLDSFWYSLNDGSTYAISEMTGIIDSDAWNLCLNGTITLQFFANDSANNIGYKDVYIRKDIIAPNVSIISPKINKIFGNDTTSFELSIIEPHLNYSWYTINNIPNKNFFIGNTGIINQTIWNGLENGSIIITFYVNDSVGNISYKSIQIFKDNIPPIININNPLPNQIFGNLTFSFQIEIYEGNLNQSWYTIENDLSKHFFSGMTNSIEENVWNTITSDLFSLKIYSNDTLGNIGFIEILLEKDTIRPQIILNSPLEGYIYEDTPLYNITYIEKNFDSMWYIVNEDTSTPRLITELIGIIDQQIWDQLPDGNLTITFYLNDLAGNIGSVEIIIEKLTHSSEPSEPPSIRGFNPIIILVICVISIPIIAKNKKKLNS
ncbi:MAG: right-handed parallel beta-helix repeat-containing protein [Promethearchaeota archaeon]